MRKIFTLLAAIVCSISTFAQDIQLETKDGQVIANGSTVTIKGEMVDMMLWGQFESNLHVKNLTEKNQGVYVTMKVVSGDAQICWGGSCVPVSEGGSHTTGIGPVSANSSANLLIETLITAAGYMNATVTRTVEVTVWTNDKPEEKISATVTFTNDEKVLGIANTEVVNPMIYAKDNVLYCTFADAANRQLQVFDVAGKLWKNIRLTSESETISLEGKSKGLYIYRVLEAGKPAVSGKFLVK